jgi:predicted ATP-binding protein involved in virulence
LIDEVDLHLHPEWQQTVLTNLLAAFPMLQFVVTTHSPQVLSSVQPESIRQIEWDGDSAHLRQPEFSLGAESPQLLQELQGVNPRPQHLPIVKKLNQYLQLIGQDQWDSNEALSLRAELDEWGHGDEPSLTKADIDIRLREFRRGRK